MEPKQKMPNIIELMGKQNKKQAKKAHQAVIAAFKNNGKKGK
jgi:hypothetical protein